MTRHAIALFTLFSTEPTRMTYTRRTHQSRRAAPNAPRPPLPGARAALGVALLLALLGCRPTPPALAATVAGPALPTVPGPGPGPAQRSAKSTPAAATRPAAGEAAALDGAVLSVKEAGATRQYRLVASDGPATTSGESPPASSPARAAENQAAPSADQASPAADQLAATGEQPSPAADETFVILPTPGVAPASVFVHAFSLPRDKYDPMTTRCTFNFGDAGSAYDTLTGFNAGHLYDKPGDYTITLSMRHADGATQTLTRTIRIAPDTRRAIYVAADGNDGAAGTIDRPLRSIIGAARAAGAGNAAVLFRRGDAFDTASPWTLRVTNLRLGAYGDAKLPKPVIRFTGPLKSVGVLYCTDQTYGLLVEDITFDSTYTNDTGKNGMPDGVRAAGQNITLRNLTILNMGYGLNGNGYARGVLVQGCVAPSPTGLRSYLAWVQGRDQVILGNHAVNSTREHIVRCNNYERLLIAYNDFTNMDRRDVDPDDTPKGVMTIQAGLYAWATDNHLNGAAGVGPLGDDDGLKKADARTQFAVIERNFFDGHTFFIGHGTSHVLMQDNRMLTRDDRSIEIDGFNKSYNRGTADVTIRNNTAANTGSKGGFLWVNGPVDGVTVIGNTYLAPQLTPGTHATAAIFVTGPDLGSFRQIRDNTWPSGHPTAYAQGGVMYCWPKWSDARGYLDPAEWAAEKCVQGDRFKTLPLPTKWGEKSQETIRPAPATRP